MSEKGAAPRCPAASCVPRIHRTIPDVVSVGGGAVIVKAPGTWLPEAAVPSEWDREAPRQRWL